MISHMVKKRYLMFILLFLVCSGLVYAKNETGVDGNTYFNELLQGRSECGGDVMCECGDVLTSSQTMWYDLTGCAGDYGLIIGNDDVTLDCSNNHKIGGVGSSTATYGVYSYGIQHFTMRNCDVFGFMLGVWVDKVDFNVFEDNTFHDNEIGLTLSVRKHSEQSTNNDVYHNSFSNNLRLGFLLHYVRNSRFWYNTFIGSGEGNAYEYETVYNNLWDVDGFGNYWDDFGDNPGYPDYYEVLGEGDGIDWYPTDKFQQAKNPSFEDDSGTDYYPEWDLDDSEANNRLPDGWATNEAYYTGEIDDIIAHTGVNSVEVYRDTQYDVQAYSSQDIPVKYGKRYIVSGYVKTNCLNDACYGTIITECMNQYHNPIWSNCGLNLHESKWIRLGGDNDWTRIQFTVDADNREAAFLRVLCYNTPLPRQSGHGIVWCDTIYIEETEIIPGGGSPIMIKPPFEQVSVIGGQQESPPKDIFEIIWEFVKSIFSQ